MKNKKQKPKQGAITPPLNDIKYFSFTSLDILVNSTHFINNILLNQGKFYKDALVFLMMDICMCVATLTLNPPLDVILLLGLTLILKSFILFSQQKEKRRIKYEADEINLKLGDLYKTLHTITIWLIADEKFRKRTNVKKDGNPSFH